MNPRHRRHFVLALLGFAVLAPALWAAEAVPCSAKDAGKHIGEFAAVTGTVDRVYTARNGMEFLDLDGHYPHAPFTAVVFAADAGKVGDLSAFQGRRVTVTGKVVAYRGKPEIVVRRRDAVKSAGP